eukprot:scaffold104647_cov28-Tisochrysis_lutea.AAC.5
MMVSEWVRAALGLAMVAAQGAEGAIATRGVAQMAMELGCVSVACRTSRAARGLAVVEAAPMVAEGSAPMDAEGEELAARLGRTGEVGEAVIRVDMARETAKAGEREEAEAAVVATGMEGEASVATGMEGAAAQPTGMAGEAAMTTGMAGEVAAETGMAGE